MATIGRLAVAVTANTTRFRKGIGAAAKRMTRFTATVKRSSARVARWGAALVTAGAAGLAYLTQRQMKAIDATAKLSKQLGLSISALEGFALGAELSGVSGATLEKGLQRLSRALGETRAGFGEGLTGLKLLGLASKDFAGLNLEKSLLKISTAIAKVEDPARRAAAAAKLFGRGGQEMLTFLTQGAAEIERVVRQNELLAGSMSGIDASKIEKANDAWARMGRAASGITRGLAVMVAPTLEKLGNAATAYAVNFRRSVLPFVRDLGSSMAKAGARLGEAMAGGLSAAKFAVANWRRFVALGMSKTTLSIMAFGEDAKHMFSTTLPQILKFAAAAWRIAFTSMIEKATAFGNYIKKLPQIMRGQLSAAEIIDLLLPLGKTADFTGLFANLPTLAKRDLSLAEKLLKGSIGRMEAQLKKDLAIKVSLDMRRFFDGGGLVGAIKRFLGADFGKLGDLFGQGAAGKLGGEADKKTGQAAPAGRPGALLKGSVEAFSASLRGSSDPAAKAAEKTAKNTGKSAGMLSAIWQAHKAMLEHMATPASI